MTDQDAKTEIREINDGIYRDFFEYSRIPMILVEENTIISLCNRAFEALSGYSIEEVQGKLSWVTMVSDVAFLEKMKNYHYKRRIDPFSVPAEYEFLMTTRSGDQKDISLSITMLPGTKRSIAFLLDITEKKKNETWYKAVFENTGLPSIIINSETTIINANTEWALLSGYSIEENEGRRRWTDFVHHEDLERMRNYHRMRRLDEYGAPRKYEFRFVRRNGEIRHMINSVTMIQGSSYSIASLMDITELKEAEMERKKLEDQLQQSRKLESIGHLAGGIAHDFNNMLAAIMGYSQIIQLRLKKCHDFFLKKNTDLKKMLDEYFIQNKEYKNSGPGTDTVLSNLLDLLLDCIKTFEVEIGNVARAGEMAEEILKASQRAGELTRKLLAFARKQTLELKPLNLNNILTDFEKMLLRTIRENVSIEINLSEDLGNVEADAGQIEQIVLNLSLNAQDAMPDGGKLIIRTENRFLDENYTRSHDSVVPGYYSMLEISDTGAGMDSNTKSRIFEPFFTTKEQGRGTGLGLATVYGIIKQHRGSIWVYSEPGKGTTFRIYLPQTDRKPDITDDYTGDHGVSGDETILIVEDQEQVRNMTSIMLKQQGYRVLEAENGHKALEIAGSFDGKIHLLLSDVVMPGMNGRELYNELLKIRQDMKSLFISGYPREILSHHGILDEGFNFMSKPVLMAEFTGKIRKILDS